MTYANRPDMYYRCSVRTSARVYHHAQDHFMGQHDLYCVFCAAMNILFRCKGST